MPEVVKYLVTVVADDAEVVKANRKAKAVGRAQRTFSEYVENALSDALLHVWVVDDYKLERRHD